MSPTDPQGGPEGEVKVRPGSMAACVFPVMFSHAETGAELWEGDKRGEPCSLKALEIGLCSSEAKNLGDEIWDTQKLPGEEIQAFPTGACLSHPASILDSWLRAVCPSTLNRGLCQGCPLPTGSQAASLLGPDWGGWSWVGGAHAGISEATDR